MLLLLTTVLSGPHSCFSYLVHGLHPDNDVLLAVPVDVPADARLEVLSDAVELLRRRDGVVDERLHLVLDEAVLGVGRVDAVDVALEGGAARRAAAQALRHGEAGGGRLLCCNCCKTFLAEFSFTECCEKVVGDVVKEMTRLSEHSSAKSSMRGLSSRDCSWGWNVGRQIEMTH